MIIRILYLTLGNTFWKNNSIEKNISVETFVAAFCVRVINWKLLGCGVTAQ